MVSRQSLTISFRPSLCHGTMIKAMKPQVFFGSTGGGPKPAFGLPAAEFWQLETTFLGIINPISSACCWHIVVVGSFLSETACDRVLARPPWPSAWCCESHAVVSALQPNTGPCTSLCPPCHPPAELMQPGDGLLQD